MFAMPLRGCCTIVCRMLIFRPYITLMMVAVMPSEISVTIYQIAQCNIPEDSHLHTRICCCETLKSHQILCSFQQSKTANIKSTDKFSTSNLTLHIILVLVCSVCMAYLLQFCGCSIMQNFCDTQLVTENTSHQTTPYLFRAVFWVILPCRMIVDRRFRGAYCLHHQG
jgi:hypothetical protein